MVIASRCVACGRGLVKPACEQCCEADPFAQQLSGGTRRCSFHTELNTDNQAFVRQASAVKAHRKNTCLCKKCSPWGYRCYRSGGIKSMYML